MSILRIDRNRELEALAKTRNFASVVALADLVVEVQPSWSDSHSVHAIHSAINLGQKKPLAENLYVIPLSGQLYEGSSTQSFHLYFLNSIGNVTAMLTSLSEIVPPTVQLDRGPAGIPEKLRLATYTQGSHVVLFSLPKPQEYLVTHFDGDILLTSRDYEGNRLEAWDYYTELVDRIRRRLVTGDSSDAGNSPGEAATAVR